MGTWVRSPDYIHLGPSPHTWVRSPDNLQPWSKISGDLSQVTWLHPTWVQALTRPPTPTPHWHWRLKPVTNLILKSDQITMKIWFVLLLQLISWRIFNWMKWDKICSLVLPVLKRDCSPQVATTSSSANLLVLVSRSLGLVMASCQITRLPKCQKRWMSDRLVHLCSIQLQRMGCVYPTVESRQVMMQSETDLRSIVGAPRGSIHWFGWEGLPPQRDITPNSWRNLGDARALWGGAGRRADGQQQIQSGFLSRFGVIVQISIGSAPEGTCMV